MAEQLEDRIRRALGSVDEAGVGPADGLLERASTRARARERHRRVALGATTACVVVAAIAGVAAITGRDTTPSDARSATGVVPTASVTATDSAPPARPSDAERTVPATVAPEETSRWRPIAAHPEDFGWDVTAVWTGEAAFVLGDQAYSYDPAADTWRALAPFPEDFTPRSECQATPATCVGEGIGEDPNGYGLVDPIVVWTGDQVLVAGGDQPATQAGEPVEPDADCVGPACYPNLSKSGLIGYVPASDAWQALASPPWFMTSRSPHVWTGRELLVWPWDIDDNPDPAYAYDPAANTWRQLPDPPIDPRQNAASVWTGTEWIVWGGGDDAGRFGREFADGAAYNPTTDSWRPLAAAPISARKTQGVWTGSEMIVMAGSQGGGTTACCGNAALSDGAAYDPATDTWRPLAGTVGHPGFEPLWSGDRLLMFAKGGVMVYDPATETYLDVCCDGMAGSAHVWTGTEALSFGSYTTERGGGIFTPP